MHSAWSPAWYGTGSMFIRRAFIATYATARTPKHHDAPPQSVVNFRNMQRRRGGAFHKNVRVERQSRHSPADRLRHHMFETSHKITDIVHEKKDAMTTYKRAESILHERMQEWRGLVRTMRAKRILDKHLATPQVGAPAWNQVIMLAIRAASPTAAWHLYCDMKREGIRPTARTFAGIFHALTQMVRARKIDVLQSETWRDRLCKLYDSLGALHAQLTNDAMSDTDDTPPTYSPSAQDITSIATAYRSYLSLLCALGRCNDAMRVFNDVCPDPYPGVTLLNEHDRLLRSYFATAEMYTGFVRDLAMCPISLEKRQSFVRQIWSRWQDDMLLSGRSHSHHALLDATAVKTLVWALSLGKPNSHVRDICALLGTYMGIALPTAHGMTDFVPVPKSSQVRFTDAQLLIDVLVFFADRKMYRHVVCCFDFALQHKTKTVDPTKVSEAVSLVNLARAHLIV